MAGLTAAQIRQYAAGAGFTGPALDTATAIALAESGGNPGAIGDQGTSYGLWQIHLPAHPGVSVGQATDPASAAKLAYSISSGGSNFGPWSTYTNGAYKAQLSGVTTAVNSVIQQCVTFVEQLFKPLGFAQSGPATAAQYATTGGAGSLSAQGWQHASSLRPGEIIVEQPGAGVSSAGHIVVVGGVTPQGGALIAQANAQGLAGGGPPSAGQITGGALSAGLKAGTISVWEAPTAAQQQQAGQLASAAYSQLTGATIGGSSAAPANALLTSGFLGTGIGPDVGPDVAGSLGAAVAGGISSVAGPVGQAVGAGVGAGLGAGLIAAGRASEGAVQGFTSTALTPWFRKNVVPLVVGVVLVLIVLGGPQKIVEQIQMPKPSGGGSSDDDAGEEDDLLEPGEEVPASGASRSPATGPPKFYASRGARSAGLEADAGTAAKAGAGAVARTAPLAVAAA